MKATRRPKVIGNVLRIVGALALLFGLLGLINNLTPAARAIQIQSDVSPICYTCGPLIAVTSYDVANAQLVVSGSNFTPGGAVRISALDAMPNPTTTPGYAPTTIFTIGQANVTAGVALTIPLGFGRFAHVPGGTFTTPIYLATNRCPVTVMQVIATDQATGRQTSLTVHASVCG